MMTYCSGPVEWLSSGSLVDIIIKNMYLYVKQDADPKFLLSFLEVIEFSSRNDRQSHRRILQDLVDVDLAETMDNLVVRLPIKALFSF